MALIWARFNLNFKLLAIVTRLCGEFIQAKQPDSSLRKSYGPSMTAESRSGKKLDIKGRLTSCREINQQLTECGRKLEPMA